jgi:hypothetical protein
MNTVVDTWRERRRRRAHHLIQIYLRLVRVAIEDFTPLLTKDKEKLYPRGSRYLSACSGQSP